MADRDNGDDKNGRKKRNFSIDDDAFASDDDRDFMDDDEFEQFINPSQKKNIRNMKPKDFRKQQSECIVRPATSLAPEPEKPKPMAPTLIPCLGCRLPFMRIKRPISLNGPKFPYENEMGYCGPCRSAVFADMKEDSSQSSQSKFNNPVVSTHIEP